MLRVVQFTFKQSSGSQTSLTTTAMATTTGKTLVACLTCFADHIGTTPMTDSVGTNTWAAAVAKQGGTKGWTAIFYASNITGNAAHTITFTPTATDFLAMVVYEIEGLTNTSPVNGTNFASASSTTHTSGAITANAGFDEIAVSVGALSAAAELTPTITTVENAWSAAAKAATASAEGFVTGIAMVPSGNTVDWTYTTSNTQFETAMIAGFKAAPGGSGAGGPWSSAYIG